MEEVSVILKKNKSFSKLSRDEKINYIAETISDCHLTEQEIKKVLDDFIYADESIQSVFAELTENTLSNFVLPFGVAPHFLLNGKDYIAPMVIEESSVIAAASKGAKFWKQHGGFRGRILGTIKLGQVHFYYKGPYKVIEKFFSHIKEELFVLATPLTTKMNKRGGGLLNIELVQQEKDSHYYYLKLSFQTCNAMGANFINSVSEEISKNFSQMAKGSSLFSQDQIPLMIMSIVSNYNPDCLVEVECSVPIKDISFPRLMTSGEEFAQKFIHAVHIANIDPYRATTHNKGIFNGIDAICLATGNDFRAIEAGAHAYAAKEGSYKSLSQAKIINNNELHFSLRVPLAVGTVGGITEIHPLVKFSHDLLGRPSAEELMMIMASVGLAQNFSAISSLVTTGIQKGHMLMHLSNILKKFEATLEEREKILFHFQIEEKETISFSAIENYISSLREGNHPDLSA